MAYTIQTAESVQAYLEAIEGLSAAGKRQVVEGYLHDLAESADHFLERYPLEHESYTFQYEYALVDGGLIYSFRFIADGSGMPYGVVQVIYVDHETEPVPS
jgi:hypothetical protein